MKTKLILFLALFITSVISSRAQSKKEIETSLKDCTTAKDSIQKELTGLSAKHDSIYKQYIAYDSMYQVVRTKVFQYKFDPIRTSELIDSLRASNNKGLSGQKDSLAILTAENSSMKAKLDSLTSVDAEKAKAVSSLKQLKELLDTKIITQQEYDIKKTVLIQKL
jgi:hypothetical protein